jgi:hypothetical protein
MLTHETRKPSRTSLKIPFFQKTGSKIVAETKKGVTVSDVTPLLKGYARQDL